MYLGNRESHFTARAFRATLKTMLDEPLPFTIGTPNQLRAIIVPVPQFNPNIPAHKRRAFAKLRRDFLHLLNQLRSLT